jgi:hypothetical protein
VTTAEPAEGTEIPDALDFVPVLRTDFVRRDLAGESVVWSPIAPDPVALDPISTVMLDVIDSHATVRELALDVHAEIGIDLATAQQQVGRVVQLFDRAALLTSSASALDADEAIARRELFISMPTPCSENASRLGTVTHNVRLGEHTIRVACDSRRGARKLRTALGAHIVDAAGDVPLGFVLTAPQGLKRTHLLTDRSGIALSESRGLDTGLHALACHLSALLPPAPGTVRIRSRALVSGDHTIVCLYPLLFFPVMSEDELARGGFSVIDRLAADVEVATGRIVNPDVPWQTLRELDTAPEHAGTGGVRTVTAMVDAGAALGSAAPPPTPAQIVAAIAANGLSGSTADLLDAAILLVQDAELRSAVPGTDQLGNVLEELGSTAR